MNKIFKLLAVLMLFSALSTGSITVHAETPVAQIVGGNTYASLEAAVEAAGKAEKPVEIELLANTALAGAVTIGDNITLDLNGKTLDLGNYNLTLSTSGKVVDSVGGGLLTTSSGKFDSSTQIAVYDTTKSGYVVADIKHQEAILSEASTGTFTLVFKPDFGTTANSLFAKSGTDAGVSIQILLSYDEGDDLYFTYTSDMIKDVYTNGGKAFYITITNFTNFTNVKATPLIVPSLGTECRGTPYTLISESSIYKDLDLDLSNWNTNNSTRITFNANAEGGFSALNGSGPAVVYTDKVSNSCIYRFSMKLDFKESYIVFGLRQKSTAQHAAHANSKKAYAFNIDNDKSVLYRGSLALSGGSHSFEKLSQRDYGFENGRWYDVEMGAIDYVNEETGATGVRIYFKVDDTVLYDVCDYEATWTDLGIESLWEEGYFTFYARAAGASVELAPYGQGLASAEGTEP